MKQSFTFLLLFLLNATLAVAQFNAPDNGELFRDDVIPRVDIYLPADSLAWILDDNNLESDYPFLATFIFSNGTVLDTLENVGFRLRGNTSRNADKKSFKVDFNTYESGRKYYGVEKMNLNGQHNDPTVSRAKICADLARNMAVPTLRSNHVELYINDAYHGLYINVEHVDEEYVDKRFGNNNGNLYKCLWPADLDYKGNNPDLYKEEFWGRRAYELKTNTQVDDYTDIAHFIDILNNTSSSQLPCELEQIFNVDQYLRFIVFDILAGNWDGPIYNKNNFYLYHNEATGQFEYIPYDLDNTMGLDWLDRDWGNRNIYSWSQTNNPRPIYTQIMAVQEYKDRFSYYMNEAISSYFNETNLFPYLDDMRNNISAFVATDTFHSKDYGFTFDDFYDGFDVGLPYFQVEDYGIKSYITTRRSNALSQLVINDISPVISQISNNYPAENEAILIQSKVLDDGNINQVEVCYTIDGSNLTCVPMLDNGMSNDGLANDGIYGVIIPAINQAGIFEYYISAMDDSNQSAQSPICTTHQITIEDTNLTLAINEFMASNSTYYPDEFGEFEDWIEIYNYGTTPIYLGNKYLSDNQDVPNKWLMPNINIEADEYIVFWADNDEGQGSHHCNFKLSAAGEFIGIFNDEANNFALIDGIDYPEQFAEASFARFPNGTGDFGFLFPSPEEHNFVVSVENLETLDLELNLSPNPVSDLLSVQISNPKHHDISIEITNILGQKVFQQLLNESFSGQIQCQSFPSGCYFLSIKMEAKVIHTEKFVKQ